MATSPRFKIYDADGYYVASAKDSYLAAAIVAMIGEGGTIRDGHRFTVWQEGSEDFPAAESYDFAAGLIDLRVGQRAERARLGLGAPPDAREPRKPGETRSIPPPPVPLEFPLNWEPVKSYPPRPPEPPEEFQAQLDQPDGPPSRAAGLTSVPLGLDSFRLITRAMQIDNWVRVTFSGRHSPLQRHTIDGRVVDIGPLASSFRLHTEAVQWRGLNIGPTTHDVFTVEILA